MVFLFGSIVIGIMTSLFALAGLHHVYMNKQAEEQKKRQELFEWKLLKAQAMAVLNFIKCKGHRAEWSRPK